MLPFRQAARGPQPAPRRPPQAGSLAAGPTYVGAARPRFKPALSRPCSLQAGMGRVGIGQPYRARLVEPFDLVGSKRPAGRAEIVGELRKVARADDRCRDPLPAEEPVEGDLRGAFAGLLGERI